MDTGDHFVLADNVEFVPVTSIDERLRKTFEHATDDIVITLQNSRTKSKVVSGEFAELLQAFRSPKTLAEVIYNHAGLHDSDPLDLADESFTKLMNLKNAGFLILHDPGNIPLQKPLLDAGDHFGNYSVVSRLLGMEDTEIYKVEDEKGNPFALKILKASGNDHIKRLYENELKTLLYLDGLVSPLVKEYGRHDENLYLIIEWCHGLTCIQEASKYRNINTRKNINKLLELSISVIDAFYHLHKQGILHGDIHPPNIIISENGLVKIIDYGYSAEKENKDRLQRGGTGFYYEPEFAKAVVDNRPRPILTEKGEQYSISVVIYKMITGRDYLDFSIDEKKIYGQIVNEVPVSFSKSDLLLPLELEQVLAKALSKDPESRYESVKHFADALRMVQEAIFNAADFFTVARENADHHFMDFLVRKFGWDSKLIDTGLNASPTCSVNYGSAGIAYMFHRVSCARQDPSLASLADIWINRASQFDRDPANCFYSSTLGISSETVGNISLYHSPTGVHLTQALIGIASGNKNIVLKSVNQFLDAACKPSDKIDLVLGKAGVLNGCSLLFRELRIHNAFQTGRIETLSDSIMLELWERLDSVKPMDQPNEIDYFGIAHGWAGFLYATLKWCRIAKRELPSKFLTRMEELIGCAVEDNNSIYWPHSLSNKMGWHGWCNGSAGHVFLWLLCYQYFKDEKFLQIAEGLSNHFNAQPHGNNCNLCCGMAGQAYAMLALYKVTGDTRHLETVQGIKRMLLRNLSSSQLRNNSLYKGEVGLGVLFSESENPAFALMPLFE